MCPCSCVLQTGWNAAPVGSNCITGWTGTSPLTGTALSVLPAKAHLWSVCVAQFQIRNVFSSKCLQTSSKSVMLELLTYENYPSHMSSFLVTQEAPLIQIMFNKTRTITFKHNEKIVNCLSKPSELQRRTSWSCKMLILFSYVNGRPIFYISVEDWENNISDTVLLAKSLKTSCTEWGWVEKFIFAICQNVVAEIYFGFAFYLRQSHTKVYFEL